MKSSRDCDHRGTLSSETSPGGTSFSPEDTDAQLDRRVGTRPLVPLLPVLGDPPRWVSHGRRNCQNPGESTSGLGHSGSLGKARSRLWPAGHSAPIRSDGVSGLCRGDTCPTSPDHALPTMTPPLPRVCPHGSVLPCSRRPWPAGRAWAFWPAQGRPASSCSRPSGWPLRLSRAESPSRARKEDLRRVDVGGDPGSPSWGAEGATGRGRLTGGCGWRARLAREWPVGMDGDRPVSEVEGWSPPFPAEKPWWTVTSGGCRRGSGSPPAPPADLARAGGWHQAFDSPRM